jgi:hypothetical protein
VPCQLGVYRIVKLKWPIPRYETVNIVHYQLTRTPLMVYALPMNTTTVATEQGTLDWIIRSGNSLAAPILGRATDQTAAYELAWGLDPNHDGGWSVWIGVTMDHFERPE